MCDLIFQGLPSGLFEFWGFVTRFKFDIGILFNNIEKIEVSIVMWVTRFSNPVAQMNFFIELAIGLLLKSYTEIIKVPHKSIMELHIDMLNYGALCMDYGSINEVCRSIINIEFHNCNGFYLPLLALHKIMKIHLFEHCCPVYLKLMTILIGFVP